MSISPFDSALYRDLFTDPELARLFTDSAEIRAMMLVEGALAKAQGALGMIPETSGAFLHRAAIEIAIDPSGLARETGQNGVCVPALVAAMRKALDAPEHAQYLHWGATSQDIIDTGLILRLRQALTLIEAHQTRLLRALAHLAQTHADTPMAGRTYGQTATPTSFGAVVASWGWPLLAHLDRLNELRPRLLQVSLSGAAGTGAVFGDAGPALRAALADALGLADPGHSWHSTRDGMAELAGWLTLVAGSLGKLGEDLGLLAQSDAAEIRFGASGASSTMPQKQNPVGASVLVALSRHVIALNGAMQGAALHRQQRDGAAWFTEWLSLPAMIMAVAKGLSLAAELMETLEPQTGRMAQNLADPLGLIQAEALSFALAAHMPRPDAQAIVKALCQEAMESGTPLTALLARDHPGLELRPGIPLGAAPIEARDFAATVSERLRYA